MTCTVCHCELTGDSEYDFSLCVVCQSDESEETTILKTINERTENATINENPHSIPDVPSIERPGTGPQDRP